MARDILGEYGPNKTIHRAARASSGGVTQAKPLPYCPPQGPTSQSHVGPGLGGSNHGHGQRSSQPQAEFSGSVGIHGTNRGNKGSQR